MVRLFQGIPSRAVRGRQQHFELLSYESGQRPAYNLAMKVVTSGVANLLHRFVWRLPEGMSLEDLSMEELVGLSICGKVQLVVVIIAKPRLPAHLYTVVD